MDKSTKFISTRAFGIGLDTCSKDFISNQKKEIGFVDAVFRGLADDGGLYYPTHYQDLSALFEGFSKDISFVDLAAQISESLFPEEYSAKDAQSLCQRAFDFEPKIVDMDPEIALLELFHGSSCAFKDFGASYLAAVMEQRVKESAKKITILTATSGDTGSAVAQSFHKKEGIDVVILYPSGRVSPLQEKQLTTLGDNVYALEVDGSFDDCQRMVKEAFQDEHLKSTYGLSSANSINIGRLVPQSFYYVYAWNILRHTEKSHWLFCTPSGNFGNLSAGLLAKRWGLDFGHILAASNENDVVPAYLRDGAYSPKASLSTLANAMDVGAPSNFERLQIMYALEAKNKLGLENSEISRQDIWRSMSEEIYGESIGDEDIALEIERVYKEHQTFICPHTAVGTKASKKFLQSNNGKAYQKSIVLSTAHAGKFSEVIESVMTKSQAEQGESNIDLKLPERLELFLDKKKVARATEANLEDLEKALKTIH